MMINILNRAWQQIIIAQNSQGACEKRQVRDLQINGKIFYLNLLVMGESQGKILRSDIWFKKKGNPLCDGFPVLFSFEYYRPLNPKPADNDLRSNPLLILSRHFLP